MQPDQLGIEDILFKQGLINANQLSAVKLESINSGKSTERIIQEHQLVSAAKFYSARAQLLGVSFIDLEGKAIPTEVLDLVPEAAASRYHIIPFDRKDDKLFVAMVDPLDLQIIQFIEKKSGLFIKPYLAALGDITKAINDQYSQNLTSDVTSALKEVTDLKKGEEDQTADKAEVIREAPVANIITQL